MTDRLAARRILGALAVLTCLFAAVLLLGAPAHAADLPNTPAPAPTARASPAP